MCRLGFGLLLLAMAVIAYAAEPGNGEFSLDSDLPTVQIAQFKTDGQFRTTSYRLTLSIVPTHSTNAMSFGSGFGSTSRLPPVAEREKHIIWAGNARMPGFFESGKASMLPQLRLESKGERLELKPRRHSLSIQWSKTLP